MKDRIGEIRERARKALEASKRPMSAPSFEFRNAYGEDEIYDDLPYLLARVEALELVREAARALIRDYKNYAFRDESAVSDDYYYGQLASAIDDMDCGVECEACGSKDGKHNADDHREFNATWADGNKES